MLRCYSKLIPKKVYLRPLDNQIDIMKKYIVIVGGGKGTRLGTDMPKQFLLLNGLPVLMHTIHKFLATSIELSVILVLPKAYHEYWKKLCATHEFEANHVLVSGGETRFHSVQNGLNEITERDSLVGIHDAVRPLVSIETIKRCYDLTEKKSNAIPFVNIVDSLREVHDGQSKMVNRDNFVSVQTPQVFQTGTLQDAFSLGYSSKFTDDASVFEAAGHAINLVEGNQENIKITHRTDLEMAAVLLNQI